MEMANQAHLLAQQYRPAGRTGLLRADLERKYYINTLQLSNSYPAGPWPDSRLDWEGISVDDFWKHSKHFAWQYMKQVPQWNKKNLSTLEL